MAPAIVLPALSPSLLALPAEVLLLILAYLDIPDLLSVSRTARPLRRLCLDPLLHAGRRVRASVAIERSIPCRPSLSVLIQHRIYISRTSLAARDLDRNLIKIKLNRSLARRPSAERLVQQGVLPEEYLQARIAPSLISTKRRIERERIKDALRHRVEEWGCKVSQAAEQERERERRPDVGVLVARFARKAQAAAGGTAAPSWGESGRKMVEMPTRAKVLGLRRFWEKVGRAA